MSSSEEDSVSSRDSPLIYERLRVSRVQLPPLAPVCKEDDCSDDDESLGSADTPTDERDSEDEDYEDASSDEDDIMTDFEECMPEEVAALLADAGVVRRALPLPRCRCHGRG